MGDNFVLHNYCTTKLDYCQVAIFNFSGGLDSGLSVVYTEFTMGTLKRNTLYRWLDEAGHRLKPQDARERRIDATIAFVLAIIGLIALVASLVLR